MRYLHDTLRQDHHLRHFGRLQYGLFLKSIGLSLEQALAFWRDEFTKKMDMEKVSSIFMYVKLFVNLVTLFIICYYGNTYCCHGNDK